jgi:uncharacterized protein (DUF2147 family)
VNKTFSLPSSLKRRNQAVKHTLVLFSREVSASIKNLIASAAIAANKKINAMNSSSTKRKSDEGGVSTC